MVVQTPTPNPSSAPVSSDMQEHGALTIPPEQVLTSPAGETETTLVALAGVPLKKSEPGPSALDPPVSTKIEPEDGELVDDAYVFSPAPSNLLGPPTPVPSATTAPRPRSHDGVSHCSVSNKSYPRAAQPSLSLWARASKTDITKWDWPFLRIPRQRRRDREHPSSKSQSATSSRYTSCDRLQPPSRASSSCLLTRISRWDLQHVLSKEGVSRNGR